MDAEKTKYLGGDLKHTHLVKGLDFALLTKVRALAGKKAGRRARRAQKANHRCLTQIQLGHPSLWK